MKKNVYTWASKTVKSRMITVQEGSCPKWMAVGNKNYWTMNGSADDSRRVFAITGMDDPSSYHSYKKLSLSTVLNLYLSAGAGAKAVVVVSK